MHLNNHIRIYRIDALITVFNRTIGLLEHVNRVHGVIFPDISADALIRYNLLGYHIGFSFTFKTTIYVNTADMDWSIFMP